MDAINCDTQLEELRRIGFGFNPRAKLNKWAAHVNHQLFANAPYIELLKALGRTDEQFSTAVNFDAYPAFEASGRLKGELFCERLVFVTLDEIVLPGAFSRMLQRAAIILGGGFDPQQIQETEYLVDDEGDLVAEPWVEISFVLAGARLTWTFADDIETMSADLLSQLRRITDDGPGPRRLYVIKFPTVETATMRERGALPIGATPREIADLDRLCGAHLGRIRRP